MKLYGVPESENALKTEKVIKQVEGDGWAVIFPRVVSEANPRPWYLSKEGSKGVSRLAATGKTGGRGPGTGVCLWGVPVCLQIRKVGKGGSEAPGSLLASKAFYILNFRQKSAVV